MDAVVIIPVYQPEPILGQLVDELWQEGNFIIIVDDGSGEESQQAFWRLAEKAVILHHTVNKGKGSAIKTALEYIRDNFWEYDIIGIMDGDGQHLVKDMEKLLFRAKNDKAALVLGVRQVGNKMPLRSRIGNGITRCIFRLVSGVYVSDTQSGLRAFHREQIENFLKISGERYAYETAVLYQCAKKKIPIVEVPIDTIYKNHENSTSHFRTVLDSMRIYRELLKFVLSSASSFVLDYLMFGLFVFLFGKSAAEILAANICARIISAVYNFLMNTKLVFHEKTTCKAAGEYAVLAIGVLLLNNILLNGYIYLLRMNVFTAKIFTEGTLFIISFAVQKIWIFKHGKIKKNKILGT